MNVTHLECANCGLRHEAGVLQNLCVECGKPLLVRYDLPAAAQTLTKDSLKTRESSLWRYREVLPVSDWDNIVSFGEGWTPLLNADRLAAKISLPLNLYIKDEGQNPTQSFKARGMTAAISMAKELGVKKVAVPSAGNAAGAMVDKNCIRQKRKPQHPMLLRVGKKDSGLQSCRLSMLVQMPISPPWPKACPKTS